MNEVNLDNYNGTRFILTMTDVFYHLEYRPHYNKKINGRDFIIWEICRTVTKNSDKPFYLVLASGIDIVLAGDEEYIYDCLKKGLPRKHNASRFKKFVDRLENREPIIIKYSEDNDDVVAQVSVTHIGTWYNYITSKEFIKDENDRRKATNQQVENI